MADGGEPSGGPKAIASLARKSSDVTRQGTQKLKFVPTLPARRKKEELKQDTPQSSVQPSDKVSGRGRGRGKGRGGREERGSAPRPPPAEMTASGPFAMGPALAGTSARYSAPRTSFTPVVPQGSAKAPTLGADLPTLKKDKQRRNTLVDLTQTPKKESDEEVYSEPDEGVEIIDMENVRQMDWMAPETLRRERRKRERIKAEAGEVSLSEPANDAVRSDALDLSESEEDEPRDLVDFAMQTCTTGTAQEQLYFFQFPEPFPTFASIPEPSKEKDVDPGPSATKRSVSFADTGHPESATPRTIPEAPKEKPKVDGVIGQLEVYRSGAVKMRLGNDIVLNVSEATQPSFFQQAVYLDMEDKKIHVLGKVNKRFVVSPDVEALLTAMELGEATFTLDDTKMDPI